MLCVVLLAVVLCAIDGRCRLQAMFVNTFLVVIQLFLSSKRVPSFIEGRVVRRDRAIHVSTEQMNDLKNKIPKINGCDAFRAFPEPKCDSNTNRVNV